MANPTTLPSPWSVLRDGLRLIARFVRTHPWAFGLAVFGAALYAAAIVASAQVVGWLTDQVIIPVLTDGADFREKVWLAVAALVGVSLWKASGIVLRRTAAGWLQFRTRQDVRNRLLDHQLDLELAWFSQQSIGDLLAVADSDTDRGTGVLAPLPYATGVMLLLFGSVAMVASIDLWLGFWSLVGLVVIVAVDVKGAWTVYPLWEEVQEQRGRLWSLAHETFDGALTVKSLGREQKVSERFGVASDGVRDGIIHVNSRWVSYQAIIRALPPALILVLIYAGASRIRAGAITAGDLVTVTYLLSLLAFPVQLIGFVLFDLSASIAGWQRVQRVFEADQFMDYGTHSARGSGRAASVDGHGVNFEYRPEEPVLVGVEMDLAAGTTLAVVGPTASGKSTLALLLARLWDPGDGAIHIDDRDVRSFARSELPREVAYVSQEAFLFDDTITGNITLGDEFTEEEVASAARLAGADMFVSELPNGYATRLGERGTSLSGGQRQRIALARALIRQPRLMILDDATSAVDPSVEAEILRSLKKAALPSTIVIVAYRPATIRLADEVMFVDEKTVSDHGTHEQLLSRSPGYAALVRAYEEDARRVATDDGRRASTDEGGGS
ncbi:MAG: ABC transporter ATP-binding protein/permease [Acidimicrobiia bacterium]|nr:ABC transporter ATP-binding protein/permease [Acidimicrobiia bacterium]MDH3397889.1 ABC transporter ATP-binding protein/permease [Acidimicrobiia bacterium]